MSSKPKKIKNPDNLSGRYSSYAQSIVTGKIASYHMRAEPEIAEMIDEGATDGEIAEELGLIRAAVSRIRSRLKRRAKKSG